MRYSIIFSASVAVVLIGVISPAAFAARGYYLQAGIGGADQAAIHAIHPDLSQARVYSGELGMFVTNHTALGIRLSFQNNDASESKRELKYRGRSASGSYVYSYDKVKLWEINTNIYEAVVRASVWVPRQMGIMLGAGAGLSHFTSDTGISSARRSAAAPVYEVFSGGQVTAFNEFIVFFRFGYAYRDFGTVEATYGHTSSDPLDLDMSGWFFEIGLGGHTRRPWSPAE
jgi:hypothetical protein